MTKNVRETEKEKWIVENIKFFFIFRDPFFDPLIFI
jgi:hypothetical protein